MLTLATVTAVSPSLPPVKRGTWNHTHNAVSTAAIATSTRDRANNASTSGTAQARTTHGMKATSTARGPASTRISRAPTGTAIATIEAAHSHHMTLLMPSVC